MRNCSTRESVLGEKLLYDSLNSTLIQIANKKA